ncbi:sulfur relay (sulfurtransferase) complex TusBCD TusD component (DsrE family) [Bradyrhizobium sp. USDA 4350]
MHDILQILATKGVTLPACGATNADRRVGEVTSSRTPADRMLRAGGLAKGVRPLSRNITTLDG